MRPWSPSLPCARLASAALALAVGLGACGGAKDGGDGGGTNVGVATLSLSYPASTAIEKVEYTLTFTYLGSDPPVVYNVETAESVRLGGELTAILPCRTGQSGFGLNQVDVAAKVYFNDLVDQQGPIDATASTIFQCERNADVSVSMLLTVVGQGNGGFVDIDVGVVGTLCSAKTDYKDDGFIAVCPDSSCGQSSTIFLFANNCQSVRGTAPEFWPCGAPTDWVLTNLVATSQFAIPEEDGTWRFGLVTLDPYRMSQVDPSITDDEANLRVWRGVWMTRATLIKAGDDLTRSNDHVIVDWVAKLKVPPTSPGLPSPSLLVLIDKNDTGVDVTYLEKYGACGTETVNTHHYDGLKLEDVRLYDESTVRLLFREEGSLLGVEARCDALFDAEGEPIVDCSGPGPLLGGAP